MSITVKRNRFGSQFVATGQGSRFMERVQLDGITISAGSEHEIMFDCLTAILSATSSGLSGHTEYTLGRVVIDSVGMDCASAVLSWEIDVNSNGGTPTVKVITQSSALVSRAWQFVLGSRIPMRIYNFQGVPADNFTPSIMMPHRVISVASIESGDTPPEDEGDAICHVNESEWRGLPKGYWLVSEHTVSVSKYSGYFQRKIAAMSRVVEDWSEIGVLRNAAGKYVTVDQADIDTMNDLEYEWGAISADDPGVGMARYGPYPTTDFDALFDI